MWCKKVSIDNDCTTFHYKIKADRCVRSCNNIPHPYYEICLPDSAKNISVKVFDSALQQNQLREIEFHESCKCD